jgi:MYXO-CTERM domain-containing protein
MGAHLGLAVNFGMIDDVLYQVWRGGLTCLTGDHLEALGIHLDFEHISALLPGFPAGTEFDLDIKLAQPPRIAGRTSDDASMAVSIEGLEVTVIGHLPDGTERAVGMSIDMDAAATVAIDPTTNALLVRLDGAEMKAMRFDQQAAATLGFDPAQLRQVMNNAMVPKLLEKLGDLPVTGSMFNFADYAIILRNLDTASEAYLVAEVDLFRAPANDSNAPDTAILSSPAGIASPATARVQVGGADPEIPSELLRYEVKIDGVARPLSPITQFTVGEVGQTRTYRVEVAAVDLNNNTDATPATLELTVDGIAPRVLILGERNISQAEGGLVDLSWTATDDTTPESALSTSLKVYRLVDKKDALSAELVEEIEVATGATSAQVDVATGELYRIEVEVTDQAGNTSSSSLLLDAGTGGCLCNAGGNPADAIPMALALIALMMMGRRRRRV